MSKTAEILARRNVVVTDDHFVYAAGDHGDVYVNKDDAYLRGSELFLICNEMADLVGDTPVDVVVGPELGGIKLSDRVGEAIAVFSRTDVISITALKLREGDGKLVKPEQYVIGRGHDKYVSGKRVLITEDVLTTGMTAKLVVDCLRALGADVVGVVALCNRGGVTAERLGVPLLRSVLNLNIQKYPAHECPFCRMGRPINQVLGKGKQYLASLKR